MAAFQLTDIPADIYKFIQEEQAKIKIDKGINQYSMPATVYKMLRDYKRCREENKNFKPTSNA